MNKLTIKELAPYLPYGLKILYTELDRIYPLVVINVTRSLRNGFSINEVIEYKCKPILRPLSDLTKDIEHNGEKVAPILVLASFWGLKNLERYETDGVIEYGYENKFYDDAQGYVVGYYNDGQLGVWYDTKDGLPIDTYSSLSVINKLLEWHFDIFGLIEKGLAIDINTLKNEN